MRTLAFVSLLLVGAGCAPQSPLPDSTGPSGGTASSGSGTASTGTDTASTGSSSTSTGGGNHDRQAGFVSGSRLKTRVFTASDGAVEYRGFYDSQLNVDCRFGTANDGETRCLPQGAGLTAGPYFADAACTAPIALGFCSGTPPAYVFKPTAGAASCTWGMGSELTTPGGAFFAVGPALSLATYYSKYSACTAVAGQPGYQYFALGAEVPPSTFVDATEVIE